MRLQETLFAQQTWTTAGSHALSQSISSSCYQPHLARLFFLLVIVKLIQCEVHVIAWPKHLAINLHTRQHSTYSCMSARAGATAAAAATALPLRLAAAGCCSSGRAAQLLAC